MHFTKKTINEKRSDLVKLLKSNKLLRFPGAYNPLCAKVISEIGFDGVYISGGVMSNDLGIPDIGLTTLNQVSYRSEQIAKVTDLPSIVDADTGFKNCEKTIIAIKLLKLLLNLLLRDLNSPNFKLGRPKGTRIKGDI